MSAPKLLVFSADSTYSGLARLPRMLKKSGFEVAVLCWNSAYLAKTCHLDQLFLLSKNSFLPFIRTMNSTRLLSQFVEVVKIWQPSIVIFGDEMTVAFAHHVIRQAAKFSTVLPTAVLELLKDSLGSPQFFDATLLKHKTLEVAYELGLRVPAIASVTMEEAAWQFAEKNGYPVVLKKSFSCAGVGVKVCQSEMEFSSSLPAFLPHPPSPIKAFIRKHLWRDWFPVEEALGLQQFIQGRIAMCPVVAIDGEVLTGFVAIKELTYSENGPSSVIRLVNCAEALATTAALIKQFQFTGFAVADFILEEGTEHAYLIEFNPRPGTVGHLGALVGSDLGAALFARISGQPWENQPFVEQEQLIALFPQEWRRDPNSDNLRQLYHDVPWDDPSLVKAYIASV